MGTNSEWDFASTGTAGVQDAGSILEAGNLMGAGMTSTAVAGKREQWFRDG